MRRSAKRAIRFGVSIGIVWLIGAMSAAGQSQDTTVHLAGNGVSMPTVVKSSAALYTAEAMKAKIQGWNMVEAVVLPDGTVGDVKVIRSLDRKYGLDDVAVESARKWIFNPGTTDGKAVAVRVTIKFAFVLK